MAGMDFNLDDWLATLPPLPATLPCPECGKGKPDIPDFWFAGEASCRGCVTRGLLDGAGHAPEQRVQIGADGRVIHGIDGTAL